MNIERRRRKKGATTHEKWNFTVIVNIGIGPCTNFFWKNILFLKYAPQSVSFSQCLCSDYFMFLSLSRCACVPSEVWPFLPSNVSRLWLTLQMYTQTTTATVVSIACSRLVKMYMNFFPPFLIFVLLNGNEHKSTCNNMYEKHGIEMDKMQPIFQ